MRWIVGGFNASFAICVLVWGVASDRIGYRAVFLLGMVIMAIASALSAIAPSLIFLDGARILAGAGGAAIGGGSSALLSHAFVGADRQRAFALFGATLGLGLALGPTVSGSIVSAFGWRGVFVVIGLVPALALLGRRSVPKVAPVGEPGKVLDLSLLRNRRFLAMVLVPVACAVGFVTVLSYLPVALSAVRGMGSGEAGLYLLPMTVPVLVGPILGSALIGRFRSVGTMAVINVALLCLVAGDLGLLLLSPGGSGWALVPAMLLLGFGFGLPLGLIDGEAIGSVPPERAGTAAGVLNFMRLGSEAVVVAVYAAVLTGLLRGKLTGADAASAAAGASGHAAAYASSFHLMVSAMAGITAGGAVLINLLHAFDRRARVRSSRLRPI
jgi:predicted MFS family arabinose efflux permease